MCSDGDTWAYSADLRRKAALGLERVESRSTARKSALPWWKERCRRLARVLDRWAETGEGV